MVLKLLAFGPAYFQSWRNLFDFILSVPTVAYAISGILALSMPSPYFIDLVSIKIILKCK